MLTFLGHQLRVILRNPFRLSSYFFVYEAILFEADLLNWQGVVDNKEGRDVLILHSKKDLEDIVHRFPSLKNETSFSELSRIEDGKTSLVFILIDGELAHYSWVVRDKVSFIYDYYFRKMNFEKEIYIGPCVTLERYRGLGLYPLALNSICQEFSHKKVIEKACILTRKKNKASAKGIIKSSFKIEALVKGTFALFFSVWSYKSLESLEEVVS